MIKPVAHQDSFVERNELFPHQYFGDQKMEAELKNLPFYINQPDKVKALLGGHLGLSKRDVSAILNGQGSSNALGVDTGGTTIGEHDIVVPTDNCLRDYIKLHNAGLAIESLPYYTNDGLRVAAIDDAGNRLLLVEKRDYAEYEI